MGIVASIVSAVLKSVVGDKLGSGFAKDLIEISIDEISEKGINEIADFIDKEKSTINRILSEENMKFMGISEDKTNYVVAEIKDLFFKISITDEVLRQCKYNNMILKDFLWNEYRENKNDYIECESEIKRCLFAVEEALIKIVRESENFEKDVLVHISNSVDAIRSEEQISSQIMVKRFDRLEESNQEILNRISVDSDLQSKNIEQKKVKSRTQEYFDKWNANMFLNDFDEWDEDAGANVKLRDVYIDEHLPHFIWGNNKSESKNLNVLITQYIRKRNNNKMLLILGQPGIGKSTLITWIIAHFTDKVNDILVYQFASDLKNIDKCNLDKRQSILGELSLSFDELDGKILILDGFDEVRVEKDRAEILNRIYRDLKKENLLHNFLLIITCRENYIQYMYRIECDYITLQSWESKQIQSFCKIYCKKAKRNISEVTMNNILRNKDVLGIPLILYMVLALDISIDKRGSMVDVYDKIFSQQEGGIYERCFKNIKKNKIERYDDPHWIYSLKKQIHQISRNIAIWMFENNSEEAYIPQEEYRKICMHDQKNKNVDIQQDFLIGNFFKLVRHCEGIETEKLYFVHRSIYEYFVAETIITSMCEEIDISKEMLACVFGTLLKRGILSENILNYLERKIVTSRLCNSFNIVNETFQLMIDNGMTYYIDEHSNNIIEYEIRIFENMLEILHLWDFDKWQLSPSITNYLKFGKGRCWNLERANLNGIDLRDLDLSKANLEGIDLGVVSLKKRVEELINGDLSLDNINLDKLVEENELLQGTIFSREQIYFLYNKYDLRGAKVLMNEGNIISFEKFEKDYLWLKKIILV